MKEMAMNVEDLIILGAVGFGAWYIYQQQSSAATPATGTPQSTSAPAQSTATQSAGYAPQTPTPLVPISTSTLTLPNIAPTTNSILNSSNPILTLANSTPVIPLSPPPVATTAPSAGATTPAAGPLPVPITLMANPAIAPSPGPNNPIAPSAPSSPAPISNNPRISWTTNRGQVQNVQPGDTYYVQIAGAIPGGTVTMSLTKDGMSTLGTIGYTDPTGAFSYAGTVDASGYQWSFNWYVNGVYAGTFTLDVGQPFTPAGVFVSGDPSVAPTSNGMPVPSPTVQPGVVPVASASPASISVMAPPAPSTYSSGGVYYQEAPLSIPAGTVTPWNI